MRVRVYPQDDTACGYYRCRLPAQHITDCHVDVAPIPPRQPGRPPARPLPVERHPHNPRLVRAVHHDADVIVIQRPVEEEALVAIEQLQAAGYALVVELDDDLAHCDPTHPAFQHLHPKRSLANWQNLKQACLMADLVTVSSHRLRCYAPHGRVVVLENRIPDRLLEQPHGGDGRTVGWSGWTVTHPGDLRAVGNAVALTIPAAGARFLQVGPGKGVAAQLGVRDVHATGPLKSIDGYYRALTRLDVGICPLRPSRFNDAKSWLKPLEMAACGAAVIASPRMEYRRAQQHRLCELAEHPKEWRRCLARLLQDESYRCERQQQARDAAREQVISRHAWRWAQAWQQALINSRQRKPAGRPRPPAPSSSARGPVGAELTPPIRKGAAGGKPASQPSGRVRQPR